MNIPVYTLGGKEAGKISLKKVFSEPVRTDLIAKAFAAEQALIRHPYGADPIAGQRSSAHYHGRRGIRNSMMNREMSRMKRIHNMGFLNMTARVIPGSVKGRKAHPPKTEKVLGKKLNKKERTKALFSAVTASAERTVLEKRGHRPGDIKHLPLVLEDRLEETRSAKELIKILKSFGLEKDLERVTKSIRAGKGTMRGRKTRTKVGPIVIVKDDKGISKAASNIPGVAAVTVQELTVSDLAPGAQPGRLAVWSQGALESLDSVLR